MAEIEPSIWERLWDHDPNGLVAVDRHCTIKLVNRAFCDIFAVAREEAVGKHVDKYVPRGLFLEVFARLDENKQGTLAEEHRTEERVLELRLFGLRDPDLVACISIDMTERRQRADEMKQLKNQALEQVEAVVDKHMKVAQEIASLLGEATAETKVSLLKLMAMLQREAD